MRFKLDENLPNGAGELFQQNGYDTETVYEENLNGRPDNEIATVCKSEGKVLITLNKDFGNIQRYPPAEFPGTIVIRSEDQSKPIILDFVRRIR